MPVLESKWDTLWKDFENVRKSEWLKATEAGEYNAMVKEAKAAKTILKALDSGETDLLNACGNTQGKTYDEVPFFLKAWVTKMKVLNKGDLKNKAAALLNNMDKATKPKTYRALKVLITGIDGITAHAEYVEKTLKDAAAKAGKEVSSQERIAAVQSMALAQVKKGATKALAEAQKVKANPTPETWTAMINNGGTRDLIMGLVSLASAQNKGDFGNVPAALAHKNACQPFNTGQAMAVLGDNDGPPVVTQRLKAWTQLVKAVVNDYQAHW